MRKFEKITEQQFKKEKIGTIKEFIEIKIPERKTKKSAGYDFYSPINMTIKSKKSVLLPTGIKCCMKSDEYLMIIIRSSIAIKHNISITNQVGIIDSDYYNNKDNEGHIYISLLNNSNQEFSINKGDRIAQGIFSKYLTTSNDNQKELRKGGIGSTK